MAPQQKNNSKQSAAIFILIQLLMFHQQSQMTVLAMQKKNVLVRYHTYIICGRYFEMPQKAYTLPGVGFRQNAREALDRAPVERGFFCSQAKADNFRNMKYIAKIKIVLRSVLTFYQNHFTASGSSVDFKVTAGTT